MTMTVSIRRALVVFHDLSRWPRWLSRWLGYRAVPSPRLSEHKSILWSFIGIFVTVALLQAIFLAQKNFFGQEIPPLIYSYASAISLLFAIVEAPSAQPRAFLAGHIIGALIGVGMSKLSRSLSDDDRFLWLTASLSCAITVVLMQLMDTVHAPGGATAVLTVSAPEVRSLGWTLLPLVIISSGATLALALMINNIQRQYPRYWLKESVAEVDEEADEKGIDKGEMGSQPEAWLSVTTLASHVTIPERAYLPV